MSLQGLKNKFRSTVAPLALAAVTTAAALTPSFAQAADEQEVRAMTADCTQAVIWYGDKIVKPEFTVERQTQRRSERNGIPMVAVSGNPDGYADVFVCSGKSNAEYTKQTGFDAIDDAYKYQRGVSGSIEHGILEEQLVSLERLGKFTGLKVPESVTTQVSYVPADKTENLIAQNAPAPKL